MALNFTDIDKAISKAISSDIVSQIFTESPVFKRLRSKATQTYENEAEIKQPFTIGGSYQPGFGNIQIVADPYMPPGGIAVFGNVAAARDLQPGEVVTSTDGKVIGVATTASTGQYVPVQTSGYANVRIGTGDNTYDWLTGGTTDEKMVQAQNAMRDLINRDMYLNGRQEPAQIEAPETPVEPIEFQRHISLAD